MSKPSSGGVIYDSTSSETIQNMWSRASNNNWKVYYSGASSGSTTTNFTNSITATWSSVTASMYGFRWAWDTRADYGFYRVNVISPIWNANDEFPICHSQTSYTKDNISVTKSSSITYKASLATPTITQIYYTPYNLNYNSIAKPTDTIGTLEV